MAKPDNKSELLEQIQITYTKLREDIVNIPEEYTDRKEMPGHVKETRMTVLNLLSYLVGWGTLVLKWHRISSEGKTPDMPDTGFKMNEMGRLAQKFYRDYEKDDFKTLLKKYDTAVSEILDMIRAMDDNELFGKPWHGKHPFGKMVHFNTSAPYKNARARIRKWKRETGLM